MIQQKDKDGNIIEELEHAKARAEELIRGYFEQAPNVKWWLQQQKNMAWNLGYNSTVLGRRRYYDMPEESHPDYEKVKSQIGRWAGNQPVQGSSADVLKDADARLYRAYRDGRRYGPKCLEANLLLVCHDEIVTEARKKDAEQAQQLLESAMTDAYNAIEYTAVFRGETEPRTVYLRDVKVGPKEHVEAFQSSFWSKD